MKKTYNKLATVLGVFGLIFLVDACLKDDRFVDFSKSAPTIEFLNAIPGRASSINFSDPSSTDPYVIDLIINQAGPSAPGADINVTAATSADGLAVYNSDLSHLAGVALPDSSYTLETSATIKAGKDSLNNDNRATLIKLTLIPAKVPGTLGVNYVVSIGITAATSGGSPVQVSKNMGIISFNFFHNLYDGDYTATNVRYNFASSADYAGWDSVANAPAAGSVLVGGAGVSTTWGHVPLGTVSTTTVNMHAGNDLAAFGNMNVQINNDDVVTSLSGTKGHAKTAVVLSTCPGYDGTNGRCGVPLTDLGSLVQLPHVTSYYYAQTKQLYIFYQYENGAGGTFRVLRERLTKNP